MYVIWSHEHQQWWGPDRAGYTSYLKQAGRYTAREAGDITVGVFPPGIEVAVDEGIAIRHGIDLIFGISRRDDD